MKFFNAINIIFSMWEAIRVGTIPTVKNILSEPGLLLKPREIFRRFLSNIWARGFAEGTDGWAKPYKTELITSHAHGTVLDLGAGHGHTVLYLDRTKVLRYVALEPNVMMHSHIREMASSAGYHESDGSLLLLSSGAEDSASILAALGQADVIISVLTLCSVPNPERTIHNLVRDILKPGGQFLFYEHVLSPRKDVAWWQKFWAPVWQYPFDGCRLDRPTHLFIENLTIAGENGSMVSPWAESKRWGKTENPEEELLWHQVGRFVKK